MGRRKEDHRPSGATFSRDMRHRYVLWRTWGDSREMIAFVGLNPSTADDIRNDPTVTRCINYAKDWGYGGMYMLNAFAFRATDPRVMKAADDLVGPHSDGYLLEYTRRARRVVVCWGNHGAFLERSAALRRLFAGRAMWCFGLTKLWEPRHPLYLARSTNLVPYVLDSHGRLR